jgi:hypothetical protein
LVKYIQISSGQFLTFTSVAPTSDVGYIAVGYGTGLDYDNYFNFYLYPNNYNGIVVKFNENLGIEWKTNFGGNQQDILTSVMKLKISRNQISFVL